AEDRARRHARPDARRRPGPRGARPPRAGLPPLLGDRAAPADPRRGDRARRGPRDRRRARAGRPGGAGSGRMIRVILFDAGGTLTHADGERFCAAAGLLYEPAAFLRAETEAAAAVRALVVRNPSSTDSERLPVFLDRFLEALGVVDERERRTASGRIV